MLIYLDAFFLPLATCSAAVGSLVVTSYSHFDEKLYFEYSLVPSKCLHSSLLLIKFPGLVLCALTVSLLFTFPFFVSSAIFCLCCMSGIHFLLRQNLSPNSPKHCGTGCKSSTFFPVKITSME